MNDIREQFRLAHQLRSEGRRDEACAASGTALQLARAALAADPTSRGALASCLHGHALSLSGLRRHREAVELVEEAIGIRRALVEEAPSVDHRQRLAHSLSQSDQLRSELGWFDTAAASEEAVDILRSLAVGGGGMRIDVMEDIPAGYHRYGGGSSVRFDGGGGSEQIQDALAKALNNLAIRQAGLGRRDLALVAIDESLAVRRELASTPLNMRTSGPDEHDVELAHALYNRSLWVAESGRPADAVDDCVEAIQLYRRMGAPRRPELAAAMVGLSDLLAAAGRSDEAVSAAQEAVRVSRRLAEGDPLFEPDLAAAREALRTRTAEVARTRPRRPWSRHR